MTRTHLIIVLAGSWEPSQYRGHFTIKKENNSQFIQWSSSWTFLSRTGRLSLGLGPSSLVLHPQLLVARKADYQGHQECLFKTIMKYDIPRTYPSNKKAT